MYKILIYVIYDIINNKISYSKVRIVLKILNPFDNILINFSMIFLMFVLVFVRIFPND